MRTRAIHGSCPITVDRRIAPPTLGGWAGVIPPGYPAGESNLASLSWGIYRWLQLIHKDQLAPLENAPFSTLWA